MSEAVPNLVVTTIGNRAAITAQTLTDIIGVNTDLGRWVTRACERSVNADVWLLPVFEGDAK